MYGVAVSESPVRRGDSLVGTYGFGLAWLQVRELDIGAVDVEARRQPCFEEQNWAVCLGQYHAVELNPDVTVGAQRVDTHVRVARMKDEWLVLFEPVKCVPFESPATPPRPGIVNTGSRAPGAGCVF